MQSIEQLVQSIDDHLRDLNGEIRSLQNARSALVTNGAARTPSRRRKAKPRSRRKPTGAPQVLFADTAERILADSDGMTTAGLAKQAGADRDQVLALLRDLETAGRIRRTGQRRGTRWHAITDEDRIRERAAELESRPSRRKAA